MTKRAEIIPLNGLVQVITKPCREFLVSFIVSIPACLVFDRNLHQYWAANNPGCARK
jgi:hypothetical protein